MGNATSPIHHVTVHYLFNCFPGADTVQTAKTNGGHVIPLERVGLATQWDLSHSHAAFETDYAGGAMHGFTNANDFCNGPCSPLPPPFPAYSYVPLSDVRPYWAMTKSYAFADRMFQSNSGPSFPAHQYLISGTAASDSTATFEAMEIPRSPTAPHQTAGCDSPALTSV